MSSPEKAGPDPTGRYLPNLPNPPNSMHPSYPQPLDEQQQPQQQMYNIPSVVYTGSLITYQENAQSTAATRDITRSPSSTISSTPASMSTITTPGTATTTAAMPGTSAAPSYDPMHTNARYNPSSLQPNMNPVRPPYMGAPTVPTPQIQAAQNTTLSNGNMQRVASVPTPVTTIPPGALYQPMHPGLGSSPSRMSALRLNALDQYEPAALPMVLTSSPRGASPRRLSSHVHAQQQQQQQPAGQQQPIAIATGVQHSYTQQPVVVATYAQGGTGSVSGYPTHLLSSPHSKMLGADDARSSRRYNPIHVDSTNQNISPLNSVAIKDASGNELHSYDSGGNPMSGKGAATRLHTTTTLPGLETKSRVTKRIEIFIHRWVSRLNKAYPGLAHSRILQPRPMLAIALAIIILLMYWVSLDDNGSPGVQNLEAKERALASSLRNRSSDLGNKIHDFYEREKKEISGLSGIDSGSKGGNKEGKVSDVDKNGLNNQGDVGLGLSESEDEGGAAADAKRDRQPQHHHHHHHHHDKKVEGDDLRVAPAEAVEIDDDDDSIRAKRAEADFARQHRTAKVDGVAPLEYTQNDKAKSAGTSGSSESHKLPKHLPSQIIPDRGAFCGNHGIQPGVSLVAVCMNRHSTFEQVLPSWLKAEGVDEVVIVDWSSTPPLDIASVAASADLSLADVEKLRLLRVNNEPEWVLSRGFNLGISMVCRENVIRLDCDYKIDPGFIRRHPLDSPNTFYSGNWKHARNRNEAHLNGGLVVKLADFWKVGGYDERIQTYGWDDEDLYSRLESSGLERLDIALDMIQHISHPDSMRQQSSVQFAQVEVDYNRLILEKLPKWKYGGAGATESDSGGGSDFISVYNAGPSNDNSGSSLKVKDLSVPVFRVTRKSRPKALAELVPEASLHDAWMLAMGRRLHDDYSVPWDVMMSMDVKNRERLLKSILSRAAEDALIKDAGHPCVMVAHVKHGIGARMLALGSALAFSKLNNYHLIVIWEPDVHCEAHFEDLFDSEDVIVSSGFKTAWPTVMNSSKWDTVWNHFAQFESYLSGDDWRAALNKPALMEGLNRPGKHQRHLYWKSDGLLSPENNVNKKQIRDELNVLRPSKAVLDKVGARLSQIHVPVLFGVHMRTLPTSEEGLNIDYNKEYGKKIREDWDANRALSGVTHFLRYISTDLPPSEPIYVVSDSAKAKQELCGLLGPRAICFNDPDPIANTDPPNRSVAAIQSALADMYAVSGYPVLIGSHESAFSLAASLLGSCESFITIPNMSKAAGTGAAAGAATGAGSGLGVGVGAGAGAGSVLGLGPAGHK